MSIATDHPVATRRIAVTLLATVAAAAALVTIVCAITWFWAPAALSLTVLLAATTGFWVLVERARLEPAPVRVRS